MTSDQRLPADHARHDRLLLVRYLDHDVDLVPNEERHARALLAGCSDCAALGEELRLISDAANHMVLPRRSRDFRLSPRQAASLRSGRVRLLEGAAAAFRFRTVRPLAGAAIAIGLLLAVIGSLPSVHTGGAARDSAGDSRGLSGVVAATAGGNQSVGTSGAEAATPADDFSTSQGPQAAALPGPETASGAVTSESGSSPASSLERAANPSDQVSGASPEQSTTGAAVGDARATGPTSPSGRAAAAGAEENDKSNDTFPALLILGVLLASVGLVIILLTYVSRRIGTPTR